MQYKYAVDKEAAEWLARQITKIKSYRDPFGPQVNKIVKVLGETIDDIDSGLYELSRAGGADSEKYEMMAITTVTTIKNKVITVPNTISLGVVPQMIKAGYAETLGISELLRKEQEAEAAAKRKPVKPEKKEQPASPSEPIKKSEVTDSSDIKNELNSIVSNLSEKLKVLETLYNHVSGYSPISTGKYEATYEEGNIVEKISLPKFIGRMKSSIEKIMSDISLLIGTQQVSGIIPKLLSEINNVAELSNAQQNKFYNITRKSIVISHRYDAIKKNYDSFINAIHSTEEKPESSTIENKALLNNKNIIIKGQTYNDVMNAFLVKNARQISVMERFIKGFNELYHTVGAVFSDKLERIVELRKSIRDFRKDLINIIIAIRGVAGATSSPQEEVAKWDAIIESYNNFAKNYNIAVRTVVASYSASLDQSFTEKKSESLTATQLFNQRTLKSTIKDMLSSNHPASILLEQMQPIQNQMLKYMKENKLWGQKPPKEPIESPISPQAPQASPIEDAGLIDEDEE